MTEKKPLTHNSGAPVADIAAVRAGVQLLTTRLLAALDLEEEVERHI